MKRLLSAILFFSFILPAVLTAQEEEDALLIERLHRMRLKQQDEEQLIRINKFIQASTQRQCTPVQQVRQRMKGVKAKDNDDEGLTAENVTINAGHENLNITDNHGTISSDVNIQIINEGREGDPCP